MFLLFERQKLFFEFEIPDEEGPSGPCWQSPEYACF